MPKRLAYEYFVAGYGAFPDDMLRYDQAVIVDQVLETTTNLTGYIITSDRLPTVGRWSSFLWGVAMLREAHPYKTDSPIVWDIQRGGHWERFYYKSLGRTLNVIRGGK